MLACPRDGACSGDANVSAVWVWWWVGGCGAGDDAVHSAFSDTATPPGVSRFSRTLCPTRRRLLGFRRSSVLCVGHGESAAGPCEHTPRRSARLAHPLLLHTRSHDFKVLTTVKADDFEK